MPAKHSKNVVLTERQMSLVNDLVTSGRYQNASEVIRDGLRVLEDRIARDKAELADIQARVARSLDQADRREFAEGDVQEVFERALNRARQRHGA